METMLKVCHLTSIHSRYDARILLKQCVSLRKNGYDVSLIVNDDKEDEDYNGVKIVSTGFMPKNRIDRFRHSSKVIFEKAISINADIYQFHDPDLMKVGIKLKRLGKKVIYDMHEDVPIDIAYKEWIPVFLRGIVSKMAFLYEKKHINKYDAIFTVTPHIVDRVKKLNKNTYMITNYPILKNQKVIAKLDKPEFNICFAGAIVRQWQHKEIIQAIDDIDGVRYLLAGSCDEGYMEELKKEKGWKKVEYYGMVSREKVEEIYSVANVGMALLMYTPTTGNKIGTLGNTKLFEYMEMELPIICSASDLWKNMVDRYQCGLAIEPFSVEEIKQAILYLKEHHAEAITMGVKGKEAVIEEYNWDMQERILVDIYEKLAN